MDWRQRLLDAATKTGRSDRAISRAARLGPNALNEIRNTDKEPRVDRVLKLIEEIGVSRSHVFLGIELSPDVEEIIQLLEGASPAIRQGFATLLRERRPVAATQEPQPGPVAIGSDSPAGSR